MHKKSWASRFLAVLILCLGLALPAAAAGGSVRDEYGLFDAAALSALEQTASTAADGHDCAVYYVTCANVGSQTAREYAKDYYRSHELGSGTQHSGRAVPGGYGVPGLCNDHLRQRCTGFFGCTHPADRAKSAAAALGRREPKSRRYIFGDVRRYPGLLRTPRQTHAGRLRCRADRAGDPAAFGIAGLVCGILCSQMRTARPKTEAAGYLSDEGLVLHRQVDLYTHTTRSQVYDPPQTETNSSSTVDSDGFGGSDGGKF